MTKQSAKENGLLRSIKSLAMTPYSSVEQTFLSVHNGQTRMSDLPEFLKQF